jgi:hypothetical protein
VVSDASRRKKKSSARFAVLFVLALALVSTGVFLVFSHYQRVGAEERRELSAAHLARFKQFLNSYAERHNGNFPERALIFQDALKTDDLIHPSWPEQPGYVYVTDARASDEANTIVIYENVPERKRKLGFQILRRDGRIEWLSQQDFVSALQAQEALWKKSGRLWKPEEIVPPPSHASSDH